jgi:hypothetical protein
MTLVIVLLTKHAVYHSADHRLTDGATGALITDTSSKIVHLQYPNWNGFVSYTGIGRSGRPRRDTSKLVIEWLTGITEVTPDAIALRLQEEGTKWLKELVQKDEAYWRHTFIVAALYRDIPQVFMISNFETVTGRTTQKAASSLEVTFKRYSDRCFVVLAGSTQGITRIAKQRLKRLGDRLPENSSEIRHRLTQLNEMAAQYPGTSKYVSSECFVFSMDKYGGIGDKNQRMDSTLHETLMNGVYFGDVTKAAPPGFAVIGVAFGTQRPSVLESACELRVIEQNEAYRLDLIQIDNAHTCGAIDINDNGWILGNVTFGEALRCPWMSQVGTPGRIQVMLLQINGTAFALNSHNMVVGSIHVASQDASQAFLMANNQVAILALYKGIDSQALVVNSSGCVAGWVGIDPLERGDASYRPCIWRGDKLVCLDDSALFESGRAIDINEQGKVLIDARRKPEASWRPVLDNKLTPLEQALSISLQENAVRTPLAIVWDTQQNTLSCTTNLRPVAINSNDIILGTGGLEVGGPERIAYHRAGEGPCVALGTDVGYEPSAMNDRGDVVGFVRWNDYDRAWIRLANGEVVLLPTVEYHNCRPTAVNNSGLIVGYAFADHGSHAVIWRPGDM